MSARQENKSKKDLHSFLRSGAASVFFGIIVMAVLLVLMAITLSFVDVPQKVIAPLALIACIIGAYFSGYICSRINGEKGFAMGLFCGAVIFAIIYITGMILVPAVSKSSIWVKLFSILLGSAIGGIIGVNKKRRIR